MAISGQPVVDLVSIGTHIGKLLARFVAQAPGTCFQFRYLPKESLDTAIHDTGPGASVSELSQADHVRLQPNDANRLALAITESIRCQQRWEEEYQAILSSGTSTWRLTAATPYRQDDGSIVWQGYTIDLTKSKQTEEELWTSRDLFQIVAHVVPVGLFHTDPHGDYCYVSARWQAIVGMNEQEALRKGWLQALHPVDRPAVCTAWCRCFWERLPFQMEYRLQRQDGCVIWVLGRAVAQMDRTNRLVGYVGSITDISERKAVEERRCVSVAPLNTAE